MVVPGKGAATIAGKVSVRCIDGVNDVLEYRRRKLLLGLAPLLFFVLFLLTLRMFAERGSAEAGAAAVLSLLGCLGTAAGAIVEAMPPREWMRRTAA
jgi:hypothetical protein